MTEREDAAFEQDVARRARAWSARLGGTARSGTRSVLARFADGSGTLSVRDRISGEHSLRSIRDLGAPAEPVPSEAEADAVAVLAPHLQVSAFRRPRPFTGDERATLDVFMTLRIIRGARTRRRLELLRRQEDPSTVAARIEAHLARRPVIVVSLDAPLLVVGDEPVVCTTPDGWTHPKATLRDVPAAGVRPDDVLRALGSRDVDLIDADEIVLPLSPKKALVHGPAGDDRYGPPIAIDGADAVAVAAELDRSTIDAALRWVAAAPEHPTFRSMPWPPARPLAASGEE